AAARRAFDSGPWPRTTPAERADLLAGVSAPIQARSEEIARTITEQNGSPISWSLMGEVFSATMVLGYYVGLAREPSLDEVRACGAPARRRGERGPDPHRRAPRRVPAAGRPAGRAGRGHDRRRPPRSRDRDRSPRDLPPA